MEKNELIQKALHWFENEYHQTPAQHGYPFIATRKRLRLFKRIDEVVFAKEEQYAQDYIKAQNFIEYSYVAFIGIVFLLGAAAGMGIYWFSHRVAFCFYLLALIVALGFVFLFGICCVCYKVVSPLEEKYQNKIAVFADVVPKNS